MRFHACILALMVTSMSTNAFAQLLGEPTDIQLGYDNLSNPTELLFRVVERTADGRSMKATRSF